MLSLAAGEYAYATIRAIGVGGATPPDPADLLRWGVKTVAANATNTNGPLVIRTLNFPVGFVALYAGDSRRSVTFGGKRSITGDSGLRGQVRQRGAEPASARQRPSLGATWELLHRHRRRRPALWAKDSGRMARRHPTHRQTVPSGPQASVPCPPGAITRSGPFSDRCGDSAARAHGHLHAEVLGRLLHAGQRRRRERAAADGPAGDQGHGPAGVPVLNDHDQPGVARLQQQGAPI